MNTKHTPKTPSSESHKPVLKTKKYLNKAMTLTELVVVIVVVAILAAIALFAYRTSVINSQDKITSHNVAQFGVAVGGTLQGANFTTAAGANSPEAHETAASFTKLDHTGEVFTAAGASSEEPWQLATRLTRITLTSGKTAIGLSTAIRSPSRHCATAISTQTGQIITTKLISTNTNANIKNPGQCMAEWAVVDLPGTIFQGEPITTVEFQDPISGTWEPVATTPGAALTTPVVTATSGQDSQIPVQWAQIVGASSYTVTINPDEGTVGAISCVAGTCETTITGLTNGTTYTITVTAKNAGNESDPGTDDATPDNTVPADPNNPTNSLFVNATLPQVLAVQPGTGRVYIAQNNGTVLVREPDGSAVTSFALGFSNPLGISFNPAGTALYVSNRAGHTVSIRNPATGAQTGTATVASSGAPTGTAVTATNLYVAHNAAAGLGSNRVTVRALGTPSTVAATWALGARPRDIVVSPDGSTAYISMETQGRISVRNTATGAETASWNISSAMSTPGYLAVSADGSKLYVAGINSPSVLVLNTSDGTTHATWTHGGINGGIFGIADDACTGSVYVVADSTNGVVTKFDQTPQC